MLVCYPARGWRWSIYKFGFAAATLDRDANLSDRPNVLPIKYRDLGCGIWEQRPSFNYFFFMAIERAGGGGPIVVQVLGSCPTNYLTDGSESHTAVRWMTNWMTNW